MALGRLLVHAPRRAIAAMLALLLGSGVARAETPPPRAPSPAEVERSKSLFSAGRKLVDAGRCDDGVPALEESVRLNDSVGGRLSLAECAKRPLDGWTHLKMAELLAVKNADSRVAFTRDKLASLEQQLALIRVEMAPSLRDLAGFELQVDRVRVDARIWRAGTIAVEPGLRTLSTNAPGKRPWSRIVDAKTGVVSSVAIAMDDDATAKAPPAPEVPPVSSPPPAASAERVEHGPSEGSGNGTLGLLVAGAGVVVAGVGLVAGLSAHSNMDESKKEHCGAAAGAPADPNRCDAAGLDLRDRAAWQADLATALVIVGGAAVVAGAALVVISMMSSKPAGARALVAPRALQLAAGLGTLRLTGAF